MHKARLKFFLMAASAVAVVILAIFLVISWLTPVMATKQLAAYGITVQGLDIKRIGLRESEIGYIQLVAEDKGIQARLENIRIGYRLSQLWNGRLDYVGIEHADLSIRPAAPSSQAPATALRSPAEILDKIPLDHFNIQRFDIALFNTDNTAIRKLEGKAELHGRKFHVELHEAQTAKPVSASATLDDNGAINVDIQRGRDQLLALKSTLRRTEEQYLSQGSMNADLEKLSAEAAIWLGGRIPKVAGKLRAEWLGHLPGNMMLNTETLRARFRGTSSVMLDATALHGTGRSIGSHLMLHVDFENGLAQWRFRDKSFLSFRSRRDHAKVDLNNVGGTLHLQPGKVRLEIAQGASLATDRLTLAEGSMSGVTARFLRPLELDFTPGVPWRQVKDSAFLVQAGKSEIHGFGFAGAQATLHLGFLSADSLAGTIEAKLSRPGSGALQLPDCRLTSGFKLVNGLLSANGSLALGEDKLYANWAANHQLHDSSGHASYTLKTLRLGSAGLDVAALLAQKSLPEISNGEISGTGKIAWKRTPETGKLQLRHEADADLKSLGGAYKSYSFTGLTGLIHISGTDNDISLSLDKLAVATANAVVPFRNLSVGGRIHLPVTGGLEMKLENLNGNVLGGYISSRQIDIDLARAHNPFIIELRQIEASQLVELQNQEGLYADGILDGILPVDWGADGISVTKGEFKARPPGGIIRYLGNQAVRNMASGNQAVKMALDILGNFHYHLMQLGINSEVGGNTMLAIQLKGRNPAYENGRPIEFSLNIEQNILQLIQSLGMDNRISERLEKMIQKRH